MTLLHLLLMSTDELRLSVWKVERKSWFTADRPKRDATHYNLMCVTCMSKSKAMNVKVIDTLPRDVPAIILSETKQSLRSSLSG